MATNATPKIPSNDEYTTKDRGTVDTFPNPGVPGGRKAATVAKGASKTQNTPGQQVRTAPKR